MFKKYVLIGVITFFGALLGIIFASYAFQWGRLGSYVHWINMIAASFFITSICGMAKMLTDKIFFK